MRVTVSTLSRPCVVGRKHAADEGDDGEAARAVFAEPIQVPPPVTVFIYLAFEERSAIRAAAACRPESAAIGTPGPGCTLPPAI